MIKVSVIVPVYNVEKYLKKCLDSIVNQTLQNIEIICVNDGSTDSSLKILEEYEKKDERIKIINQKNQKQGAARNRGLEIARGEFVTFVDADDWVDDDYLELLYNAAIKYNVNIAAASTTRDYKNKTKTHLKLIEEKVFYGANDIVKGLENNLITHSKLYKFEPIKDLKFPENVFFEDAPYTLEAILCEQSMVTVPNAHYHYYSNPTSTIKTSCGIKKQNDKIEMNLLLCDIAEKNNVDIGNWPIIKERHLLWGIKHYKDYKDYYICGIKVTRRNIKFDNSKIFVVFNTACFGDVLLCNSLVQNIKQAFSNSKVIFTCDKNLYDVAKYQEGVDEVVVYDKKGKHKGLFGMLKFVKEFKYKKPFVSFITYKNERNYVIAKLLGSRFIEMAKKEVLELTTQEKHNLLLQPLTHKPVKNYPIKYNLPGDVKNILDINSEYIVLCTTSKRKEKDMPIDTAIELINRINFETSYKVVFVGTGKVAENYSAQLKESDCDFIDLTNKTNILELGKILKDAKGLISVDTGTMHLGYALSVPTIAVFYEKYKVQTWAPSEDLYKVAVIDEDMSSDSIYNAMQTLLKKEVCVE